VASLQNSLRVLADYYAEHAREAAEPARAADRFAHKIGDILQVVGSARGN